MSSEDVRYYTNIASHTDLPYCDFEEIFRIEGMIGFSEALSDICDGDYNPDLPERDPAAKVELLLTKVKPTPQDFENVCSWANSCPERYDGIYAILIEYFK